MNYLKRAKQFRTKKCLGQNFLVCENTINLIVKKADIQSDDVVVEIGPGIGFVTEQLAQRAGEVIAIEIDENAITELKKLPFNNIKIIHQDVLKTDISIFSDKKMKVVANIPYYITSPILVHLLGEIDQPDYKIRQSVKEIILMVQYEVAQRIVATESSPNKAYGTLSVLCNYWSKPEIIAKVPANCFYPAPKVDSALLKLTVRDNPPVTPDNPKLFRQVVQAAFGVRRKTIKNALGVAGFNKEMINISLERCKIDPKRRGETFSMEEFKLLSDVLNELQKNEYQKGAK